MFLLSFWTFLQWLPSSLHTQAGMHLASFLDRKERVQLWNSLHDLMYASDRENGSCWPKLRLHHCDVDLPGYHGGIFSNHHGWNEQVSNTCKQQVGMAMPARAGPGHELGSLPTSIPTEALKSQLHSPSQSPAPQTIYSSFLIVDKVKHWFWKAESKKFSHNKT